MLAKIPEKTNKKKKSIFFKVGEIMVSKYRQLILKGIFPDKITLVIDSTDEAVVNVMSQL